MNNGWIKLHRKMLDNPVVFKDSDHVAVWIYLLLEAAHTEYPTMFGGKKIILKPGQLVTGRKKISEATGVQESKVKRIISLFKLDHQIDQQAERYGSLITIHRWDEYQHDDQQSDQQVTNKRPTSDQRVTTKQEDKECKKGKNIFSPPTVEEVREYCKQRGNNIDPEEWWHFYNSKNWMIGKDKMKSWKSSIITWEKNEKKRPKKYSDKPEPPKYQMFEPEPPKEGTQMPDYIRERMKGMFD